MRALLPHCLAALTTAAAVFSATAPAAGLTAGPVHASIMVVDCPAGTHWDHILQRCVSG
jgi:hypothetical protein